MPWTSGISYMMNEKETWQLKINSYEVSDRRGCYASFVIDSNKIRTKTFDHPKMI
jgi:hypothetical protein